MGFSRRKIPRSSAYTISEKAILFQHSDYDADLAQKLISFSISRHLSTRNISSKSMHARVLSNLVNRQTDRQTNTGKTCTSSFVGGKCALPSALLVYFGLGLRLRRDAKYQFCYAPTSCVRRKLLCYHYVPMSVPTSAYILLRTNTEGILIKYGEGNHYHLQIN